MTVYGIHLNAGIAGLSILYIGQIIDEEWFLIADEMIEEDRGDSFEGQEYVLKGKHHPYVVMFQFDHQFDHALNQVPHFLFINIFFVND